MKLNLIISLVIVLLGSACKSEAPADVSKKAPVSSPMKKTDNDALESRITEQKKEPIKKATPAPEVKKEEKTMPVEKVVKKDPAPAKKIETVKKTVSKKAAPKKVAPPKPVEKPKPILFFPDTIHDYGFIDEGDTIRHSFRFLNDGTVPLEILDVQVSCGCTIPVYSLTDIAPGRLSKIDITFLSKGKIGPQEATIDVLTNARNARQTLYLKGVIR